jgi:protocatechuate 3,4-dioxygenase beta subunit
MELSVVDLLRKAHEGRYMRHRLVYLVLLGAVLLTIAETRLVGGTTPPAFAQPAASVCTPSRVTPAVTEGPFYKSGSPQRTSLLEPNMPGTKVVITGQVFTTSCRPVAGAWLDFWQADARGEYDNAGYRLRGHQVTDSMGHYSLETVVPGEYPGRTPHLHVKVMAPNRPALTTQLYFPGAARNQSDSLFRRDLLLEVRDTPGGKAATFNFVLDVE